MVVGQNETTIGDRNDAHTFIMEVRRKSDGRWVNVQVYAGSRLKAAKLVDEAGYQIAGGDTKQVR